MRFLCASIALLVFGAVVVMGHSIHHGQEHGHHQDHEAATSYTVVTKHEYQGHDDHHGGHVEHSHGHYEHHGDNGHGDEHHDHEGHDDGNVQYEFKYGVKDLKTGDIKEQWESRDGHSVKGGYTLKEADGTTRLVKYTSDKKNGFEATVHKIGHAHHNHNDESYHGHSGHH